MNATHHEAFAAYFQIQNTEEKCKTLEKRLVKYEESESKINGEFLDFYLIYISCFSVWVLVLSRKDSLIYFGPIFHYISWKHQKAFAFLTFSGGIELKH